jgi:hypothetical protein
MADLWRSLPLFSSKCLLEPAWGVDTHVPEAACESSCNSPKHHEVESMAQSRRSIKMPCALPTTPFSIPLTLLNQVSNTSTCVGSAYVAVHEAHCRKRRPITLPVLGIAARVHGTPQKYSSFPCVRDLLQHFLQRCPPRTRYKIIPRLVLSQI